MVRGVFYGIGFLCCFICSSCGWTAPEELELAYATLPQKIDFNYHVKPILSDKCFACHGPDMANQKAGLRLDIAANAFEALEGSGKSAIVPGSPNESELVRRILSTEPAVTMPPPEFHLTLTSKEKATLTKWIEQGAEYKKHWSFIVPKRTAIPRIKDSSWANNEIDYFVSKKLESENLTPSQSAGKEILIRRVSFDLIGLPPSSEQIADFVADPSETAYENLVDRLLASKAYGERMAAQWMDVARFSETDGYLDDKHRDFSPYRDWVITSFNQNMAYSDFVTNQLAGDLLPNATQETLLATAFNRLHKKNSEAGIIFEEYRQEYVADRTLTVGKAFLGLSVECARCHDHKYDAISQKEHFEIAAFFNSTNEFGSAVYGPGQVPGPSLLLTNQEQDEILQFIDKEIDTTRRLLRSSTENTFAAVQTGKTKPMELWHSVQKSYREQWVANYTFDELKPVSEKQFQSASIGVQAKPVSIREPEVRKGDLGKGVFVNDYTTISVAKPLGSYDIVDPFSISVSVFPDIAYEEAGIFYHCENLRLGLKGYSLYLENNQPKFIIAQSWPSNALQVKAKKALPIKEWTNIAITYDGLGKAGGIHMYLNGKEIEVAIEFDNLYKSIVFEPDPHTYEFNGFQLGVRDKMKTLINGGLDELRIHNKELSALEVLYGVNDDQALEILKDASAKESRALIANHLVHTSPESRQLKNRLRKQQRERLTLVDSVPEIMVLGDLPEPRPTYILDRGMYDSPTEEVFPNGINAVLDYADSLPKNRLGLTKWLFDVNNPLTSRVYVNRLWQQHFGRGLVATSDDFGNQGDLPSHPELLDWLAVTFREEGWDIKKMHRRIVMSATYRQASKVSEVVLEKDFDNKLLTRGPSFRMTAEMLRDNALAISGLLSTKIGGPSVYPYQPEGLWDEISNKPWRYRYLQEPGEGLYRRSIYTIWKRSSAPPSMLIFDVGERGVCTVKRRETSTPLQALVLLNDPQFVEASRVLAESLMEKYPEKDVQLKQGYRIATGRIPKPTEFELIKQFYDEERERFSQNKADALAYTAVGSKERNQDLEVVEVASLATVMNGVMNTTDGFTIR